MNRDQLRISPKGNIKTPITNKDQKIQNSPITITKTKIS